MPVCFMPHMHMVVWKLQNGAKSLFKLGAGQKLTCLDPLRKGCRDFFDNYWSGTPYLQLSLLSTAGYLLPTLTPDVELIMYLPRHIWPSSIFLSTQGPSLPTVGQPRMPLHHHLLGHHHQFPTSLLYLQSHL
jgi:hypothetical protein